MDSKMATPEMINDDEVEKLMKSSSFGYFLDLTMNGFV